jgi:hypothetical protein
MPSSESGACRPLFWADRNGGRHGSESVRGEVTLDNPIQMWQAISIMISRDRGSNDTRKVIHAKDCGSIAVEMGVQPDEPGDRSKLFHLTQYGQ